MTQGGFIFKRELLQKILRGEKMETRRFDDGFELQRDYAIRSNYNEKAWARVLIMYKRKQQLGRMCDVDAKREGFNSLEEFQAFWRPCYHHWNPKSLVWVYGLFLLESTIREDLRHG